MTRASIPIFVPHMGCPRQCSFCDQHTISGARRAPGPEEAAGLCQSALARFAPDARGEIAFFGGSFTAIPRGEMTALLAAVQPFLQDGRITGIRVSTRPDAVDEEMLDILEAYGVSAIELGAQSMYNKVLTANRRGHLAKDVARASALIRDRGLALGLQMMTGLYGSSREMDLETGRRLADLGPREVRIYPTVVLAGTHLDALLRTGAYTPPTLEETVDLCADLLDLFGGRDIRVLRVGLHASREMEARITGGCYHPALGELCQSRRILRDLLSRLGAPGVSQYTLQVNPRYLSQVVGQKRQNMRALEALGFQIAVRICPDLAAPYILTQGGAV